jgi:hypothetical protein
MGTAAEGARARVGRSEEVAGGGMRKHVGSCNHFKYSVLSSK